MIQSHVMKETEGSIVVDDEKIGPLNSAFKHVVGTFIAVIKMKLEISGSIKAEVVTDLQQQTQFFLNEQLELMKNEKQSPYYINKEDVRALCQRIITEDLSNIEVMRSIIKTYLSIVK